MHKTSYVDSMHHKIISSNDDFMTDLYFSVQF